MQADECYTLKQCKHTFHEKCVNQWFESFHPQRSCPLCRLDDILVVKKIAVTKRRLTSATVAASTAAIQRPAAARTAAIKRPAAARISAPTRAPTPARTRWSWSGGDRGMGDRVLVAAAVSEEFFAPGRGRDVKLEALCLVVTQECQDLSGTGAQ